MCVFGAQQRLPAFNRQIAVARTRTAIARIGACQFRFPKYEIQPTAALNREADRPLLEKLAADTVAGGVVNLEITVLTNRFHHGFFDDETYESTYLTLTLSFYNKQTSQYGKLATSRSATEIVGVFSGPTPLALAALEDLLNQLDKVFPRLFPGPRY